MPKKTDSSSSSKTGSKLDLATLLGLLLALVALLGGLLMEGGQIRDVSQITAALIVLGGTIGAVMVNTPLSILKSALSEFRGLFFEPQYDIEANIEKIVEYAGRARKFGIVSLEAEAESIEDPFMKKALSLAIDGTDMQEIRAILELDSSLTEGREEASAKVFECAGGYAPTIGIIGAVMGLIQVMKHLEDIKEVGHGIAVAFVATVYGVASSNLFFLPASGKIRARTQFAAQQREMVIEGVLGMAEGLNPKLLRRKLMAFSSGKKTPAAKPAESAAAAAA